MTPKEKAEELWELFTCKLFPLSKTYVKNASLACVDEIIKAGPAKPKMVEGTPGEKNNKVLAIESRIPYWHQVKVELQKMQS